MGKGLSLRIHGKACASERGHGNETQDAGALIQRIHAGGAPTRRDRVVSKNMSWKRMLLVELATGTASQLTKGFKRYGYALRITTPRRSTYAKKKTPQLVAKHPPPKMPKLILGKVVCWRLDLRAASHVKVLHKCLATFLVPLDVQGIHLHSAPPCTWVNSGQYVNIAMKRDLRPQFLDGARLLKVCRKKKRQTVYGKTGSSWSACISIPRTNSAIVDASRKTRIETC